MDPEADPRSYVERLESYFLSLVRKGMALRPADIALIREWQRQEVPEDLVRRGLAEGVRRFLATADPKTPLPSSLRYYRPAVDAEIAVWKRALEQGRRLATATKGMAAAVDLREAAREHARSQAAAAPTEAARQVWMRALEALDAPPPGASWLDLLDALDERLVEDLIRCADEEVRRRADRRVEEVLAEAKQRGAGAEALADLRRAERRMVAEEWLDFQGLLEAVRRSSEATG